MPTKQKRETMQKTFKNRAEAWQFMWDCDKAGVPVGFPHQIKGTDYWSIKYFAENKIKT